jgi:heptosyltransferase II
MNSNKRILIFNVNWLGDVLFSTATIRNIRRNFPDSFIACIIPSRCYPVLKGNPHLDEIIIFDEKDRHKGILAKFNFIRSIKAKRFDMVFLLHGSFTRAFICWLAGIPERFGYNTKKRAFLLTKSIQPLEKDAFHRIDNYLYIIEKSGLKTEDRYLEFFIGDEDEEFVNNFLNKNDIHKNDFLALLNPGGNWFPKRWPKEYWADLADKLISEFKAKVIISGSPSDVALAKEISRLMEEKPLIAAGVLNIKQLAALCKRSDLFVSADSGPLHIANAVGARKIIAIFGPTSPGLTGPYPLGNVRILHKDVGCKVPCYEVECKDNRCMKTVTVADVVSLLKDES